MKLAAMSNENKEAVKFILALVSGVFLLVLAAVFNDMRSKIDKTYDFVIKHEEQLTRSAADIGDVKSELRELRFSIQSAKFEQTEKK